MKTSIPETDILDQVARLRRANQASARRWPGDSGARQPVHTVYGGAHLFRADTAPRLGALALRALEAYAPDAAALAGAVGIPDALAEKVYARVAEKLRTEPVEDFRIDFEDGYGVRSDAEEDGHARSAALEVAKAMAAGTLPPFAGIRIKPLGEEHGARAMRTLDGFVTALAEATGGALPPGFVVTLPKITVPEQVEFLVDLLQLLEPRLGWSPGTLRFEVMVEVPQSVFDADGRATLPAYLRLGGDRLRGAHFGTYDYTASLNVTAAQQRMHHPACRFARHVMQATLAGTGVWLSDGSTTVMPVPVHRAAEGAVLSGEQQAENRAGVHRAWRMHYDDVTGSLVEGFYQGWDLHPAQLVTRYAAVFAFFLEGLEPAAARLRNFVDRAAQATLVGDVFDDAATGQGLLNYFLRAINCGAVTEGETAALTGLTHDELRTRSFVKILAGRR